MKKTNKKFVTDAPGGIGSAGGPGGATDGKIAPVDPTDEANKEPEVATGKLSREGALPIGTSPPCEVPDVFSGTDAQGVRRLYI